MSSSRPELACLCYDEMTCEVFICSVFSQQLPLPDYFLLPLTLKLHEHCPFLKRQYFFPHAI